MKVQPCWWWCRMYGIAIRVCFDRARGRTQVLVFSWSRAKNNGMEAAQETIAGSARNKKTKGKRRKKKERKRPSCPGVPGLSHYLYTLEPIRIDLSRPMPSGPHPAAADVDVVGRSAANPWRHCSICFRPSSFFLQSKVEKCRGKGRKSGLTSA